MEGLHVVLWEIDSDLVKRAKAHLPDAEHHGDMDDDTARDIIERPSTRIIAQPSSSLRARRATTIARSALPRPGHKEKKGPSFCTLQILSRSSRAIGAGRRQCGERRFAEQRGYPSDRAGSGLPSRHARLQRLRRHVSAAAVVDACAMARGQPSPRLSPHSPLPSSRTALTRLTCVVWSGPAFGETVQARATALAKDPAERPALRSTTESDAGEVARRQQVLCPVA